MRSAADRCESGLSPDRRHIVFNKRHDRESLAAQGVKHVA
ncbi:hypothetical protein LA76x_3683 [Lysobacter antibioticus]|uniref:Uncharacterized protein n=1 Tax=Lysobacter antibioticus TaxID=84531 RepID=A0A0S2FEA5_LYSAN|nr:hypothetical protein LA76x_3683 [Lysobacter antibioticus]